jgi:hypothetical protein
MLFTEDYIFLAFPKTGSTFVRKVVKSSGVRLKRRHAVMPKFLRPKNLYYEQLTPTAQPPYRGQHLRRSQIYQAPSFELGAYGRQIQRWKKSRERQVIAIWRDPVQRISSIFRFQHWAEWEGEKKLLAKSIAPHFPDMTLTELYQLRVRLNDVEKHIPSSQGDTLGIGPLGWQFILFFASESLMSGLKKRWPVSADEMLEMLLLDTQEIKFLDQRFLAREVAELLEDSAFNIDPALLERKINVTEKNRHFKSSYEITDEDRQYIRSQEAFLYAYWEKRSSQLKH